MYDSFDTFFHLPAILIGIGTKIWDYAPGSNPKLDAVHAYWQNLGLITQGRLTQKGRQMAEDSQPLIEYYLLVVNELLSADYSNPTSELPVPARLRELQQDALRLHYKRHVKSFWAREQFRTRHGLLIDVCGGHGCYAADWVRSHKNNQAVVLDLGASSVEKLKDLTVQSCNVLTDPWHVKYAGQASVVLFSEALSQFTTQERFRLLSAARGAVNRNGIVVVHERNPSPTAAWVQAVYRPGTGPLGSRDIAELMITLGGELVDSWRTVTHYGSCWKLRS